MENRAPHMKYVHKIGKILENLIRMKVLCSGGLTVGIMIVHIWAH